MTPHKNRLSETVLMRGHNICFNGEVLKIIPKLSLLLLLIWSPGEHNITFLRGSKEMQQHKCAEGLTEGT